MRKITKLLLAMAMLCLSLTACAKGTQTVNPEPTPEPTPTPKIYYQDPLTGLEQASDYPYGQRPVAVMVNNIMSGDSYQSAWPQSGLSDADIIFEMETEGGITRYMAVYRDYNKMPVVGPIRSARDQFVQMMIPMGCLYVHDGASTYAKAMLERYVYSTRDLIPATGIAFRDLTLYNQGKKAKEHTEYTSGELIAEAAASDEIDNMYTDPALVFDWVKYDEPARELNGIDVSDIYWHFSRSYAAEVKYDRRTNKYTKEHINLASKFSRTMVDANKENAPVEFDNVFVLWTTIERYPDGVLSNVSLSYGGVGYYFNGGKMEKVRWMKGDPHEPLRIVTLDGTETPVEINPGKSYVAVVSLDYFGTYALDDELVDAYGDYTPAEELEVEEGLESTEE